MGLTLNGALEKGFTGLTRSYSVMESGCNISAHETEPFRRIVVFKITLKNNKHKIK